MIMTDRGTEMTFRETMAERTALCEEVLRAYLPQADPCAETLAEAVRYSLLSGGKRLRPMLVETTGRMYRGREALRRPFMAALEMIHSYSLVHDDLPCMDDDEYRRGRKTTHIVFGEGMAVLAGDALLNSAVETALSAFAEARDSRETEAVITALRILMKNAGLSGMIGGQCADLEAEDHPERVDADVLYYIHKHKTGCMIESGFLIGAVLAGAPEDDLRSLKRIAECTGVAFQIRDDILDVTGDSRELGKLVGSDEKDGKTTYVTMHGLERAVRDTEALTDEALSLLDSLTGVRDREEQAFLRKLTENLVRRTH